MKWLPVILSVVAALIMLAIGSVAVAVHWAHSYSTYAGWKKYGIIKEKAAEEYIANLPPEERQDILEQLRQTGNVRFYLRLLSRLSAILFLLNGVAVYWVFRDYERRKQASETAHAAD